MARWWPALLPACVALWLGGAGPSAQAPADGGDDRVIEIVLQALERTVWYQEENVAARYRARMTREVRRFDGDGDVRTRDVGDYEVVPIDGAPFERRLTVDDRPLNAVERRHENEREQEFREDLRRRRGDEPEEEDENAIVFDEELIGRYRFTLEGEEPIRNRPAYRISFAPRPGRLPVNRRIDYALNKARGRFWIDTATHEPARGEFELIEPVRLWWGMLGRIQQARGSFDRGPVLGDLWARIQYETYSDVRVLFSRTRRAEFRRWRDFEFVEDGDGPIGRALTPATGSAPSAPADSP